MKNWGYSQSDGLWHGYENIDNIKEVVIEDGIESVGDYAFANCTNLKSITISDSVKTIGKWAFNQCNSLTTLDISSKIEDIQLHALDDCKRLKSINVSQNNKNYTSLDGVLFDKNKTRLIQYPSGKLGEEYLIPEGVKTLGISCFARSRNVKKIIVPACVENIEYDAFYNCDDLSSIEVNNKNIKYLSENGVLFSKDKAVLIQYPTGKILDKYIIPGYVKIIGEDAFAKSSLKNIEIPNSVTKIKSGAFYGCGELEQLELPSSIEEIGDAAFSNCNNLTIKKIYCYKGIKNYKNMSHYYIREIKKATLTENGTYVNKCRCGKYILDKGTIYHPQIIELSQKKYVYNAKQKMPSVIVKDSMGNTINSSYYIVEYEKGRKNVGDYEVEVKFNGDYSGEKLLKFSILPKGTKILKIKSNKRKISVVWKKQIKQTTGYQIEYSTSKNFKKNNKKISINKNKTVSKEIFKIKSKKNYYVRMRTYKKTNEKKFYSEWSKVTKIKTK